MRVFHEPKVILVARPSIDWFGVDALLAEYGFPRDDGIPRAGWKRGSDTEGDLLPELMGRLCYGSFGQNQGRIGAEEYMANILDSGHGSVLEHANWSFVVCRASRGFTHQCVRHRAGFAFSQESTHFIRYGDASAKGIAEAGVCLTGLPERYHDETRDALEGALWAYEQLWKQIREDFSLSDKSKKEISGTARGLLPTAIESRLGFTANARALRHFCELRGNTVNTLEIRLVAIQVAEIMMREAPALFQDCSILPDLCDNGIPVVSFKYKKV